jgi:CO dehydrogenase maturation factor
MQWGSAKDLALPGLGQRGQHTIKLKPLNQKNEGSPFYNINPKIDDLPGRFMLERGGIRLMVLGAIQTGNSGCACAESTVLKRLLTKLLLAPSQVVLLDMEAGVEHLGRGTIAGIDHLLIVVIPSHSSVRTALKIHRLAGEVKIPKVSFVGNLIAGKADEEFLTRELPTPPIAYFQNSEEVKMMERSEQPIESVAGQFAAALEKIVEWVWR